MVPFKRLSWRSRKRSWSRRERGAMGPRSEWEGRESETTRWLLGEQTTPVHAAAHASAPVQLDRRLP